MRRRYDVIPGTGNLTICSVSFYSKPFLELNLELTTWLNSPGLLERWIVVENTPKGEAPQLSLNDARFDVYEGLQQPDVGRGRGSYHHGKGLNRALKKVKSRFILMLDPDFYVIQQDWIERVLSYMERQRLAFFGAPWHPRWYRKWRYFPCAHCMFIDTHRIDRRELDFQPEIYDQPRPYFSRYLAELEWMLVEGQKLHAWLRALKHLQITLEEDHRRRSIIGSSRDTAIRIYDRFAHLPGVRFATLTPVYRPYVDRLIPPPDVRIDTRSTFREVLEIFRPDWMSFIPKRRGYSSREGFRHFALPDLHADGWEEFLWLGRPFGFHIRRAMRSSEEHLSELQKVERIRDLLGYVAS